MFSITTKSDYGFIVLLTLAKHYNKGYLSLSQIAKNKKLSAGYLAQLIRPLVKSGLVVSKEGKGGGYTLAKNPKDISVLDVLEALEGPVKLVKCLKNNHTCSSFHFCEVKELWPVIIKDMQKSLAHKNIASLLRDM